MVNVIDNGARNRTNKMPVGIKIIDDKGDVAHTAKTDLGTNYISLESKWFGSSSNNTGGGTGGNTGGNPTGTDTSGGINNIPGNLSDGSLSGRYLEWKGQSAVDKPTTITFDDDVGNNLNRIGDGLQFDGHIQKVLVDKGKEGAVTSIPITFSPSNAKASGEYVTTSPIPFSIDKSSFIVGKKLTITLNGIGEGLSNIKDHVSPTVSFTFNADKTMTMEVTQGHDLDGGTSDSTGSVYKSGAFYTYVLDRINSYSVQNPVTQLPSGMSLMSGDSNGTIPLKFVDDNYSNINGLQITFNPKISGLINDGSGEIDYVNFDDVGLPFPRIFKINKYDLVINNSYLVTKFNDPSTIKTYKPDGTEINNIYAWNGANTPNDSLGRTLKLDANSGLIILNKSIDFNVSWTLSNNKDDKSVVFKASIIDISTF
ncbi:hypothetical protein [Companilactobacillus alimentarius]|uniref:hypothetical protein n=1 Tax=Companilactobacillus alimentarius TaxID=1602 RepID=UPI0028B4E378|nr:hypothetical protein [Companilactobacillus alimentarius]MDT6951152.1 hypothetical protein [Companilactobacillus alimentarius]MDT6953610.1 hypothetical protein [Companilactobacillus alimentarius]MDT6953700.1 hypothetical protein [Companilactobacillus alimentarius]